MPINWFQTRKIVGTSASLYEKKLAKIYLRIEKLSSKGKNNYLEFFKLVDELVEKGDYSAFEQCLFYYYGLDIIDASSIDSIKKSTWDEICFQTNTPFLVKLKKIYDQKKVYQVSYDIFSSDNDKIQLVLSSPLSSTFSNTGITQSFSIFRVDDAIYMNVLNPSLYSVSLDRSVWATESGVYQPLRNEEIQQFYVGTYSGFKSPTQSISLDIPSNVVREYFISTEEKQNLVTSYTYSGSFLSSTYSQATGTAKWPIIDESTAYYLEISKSPTFSIIEQKLKIGTHSNMNLSISGLTASYLLENLSPNYTYHYRMNFYRGYNRILNYRFALLRDTLLGRIKEVDILTPDAEYYQRNSEFAKIQGARKSYLEVYKRDDTSLTGFSTTPLILAYDNLSYTEDQNLLIRYSQACDYLNSLF